MIGRQSHLTLVEFSHPRIDSNPVEAIEEDREPGLRHAHFATPALVERLLSAKELEERIGVGHSHRGAIDSQEPVTVPKHDRLGCSVKVAKHGDLVELDKSGMAQLGASM